LVTTLQTHTFDNKLVGCDNIVCFSFKNGEESSSDRISSSRLTGLDPINKSYSTVRSIRSGYSEENPTSVSKHYYSSAIDPVNSNFLHPKWDNTPLFRKKSPVIKIYFPGNDTPTTNKGFSPSVVVVCHFQGKKFL
jgi:hypothetical protein